MSAPNPFVHYRRLLESYRRANAASIDDDRFVSLVRQLDAAVAALDGKHLAVTPFTRAPSVAQSLGLDGVELWIKNETGNVGGSHKVRHLFGLMLHLLVDRIAAGQSQHAAAEPDLAIASCGNAALAAAIVARAVDRRLQAFIPVDADQSIVVRLRELGVDITVCEREPGVVGDPAYRRFREALGAGALAFSCQGTDAPGTIDGGRTIAWELGEQLAAALGAPARLDRIYVQVGGGALASAVGRGLIDAMQQGWLARVPALHAVQTAGAFPLVRAWDLLVEEIVDSLGVTIPPITCGLDRARAAAIVRSHRESPVIDDWLRRAAGEPERFMWPWEDEPRSIAAGILDDMTYDWIAVADAMLRTGGWPVIVDDDTLIRANDVARDATAIDVDHTGSAGLAGIMACARFEGAPSYGERVAVLFTGVRRG